MVKIHWLLLLVIVDQWYMFLGSRTWCLVQLMEAGHGGRVGVRVIIAVLAPHAWLHEGCTTIRRWCIRRRWLGEIDRLDALASSCLCCDRRVAISLCWLVVV